MDSPQIPLSERIANSYKKLSDKAKSLNHVSDELGQTIAALDLSIKDLNLGISAWVHFSFLYSEEEPSCYSFSDIGYDKIGGRWGICIQSGYGDRNDESETIDDRWLFNDAPRALRIRAVDAIPDLIDALTEAADSTTRKMENRLLRVQQLAAVMGNTTATSPERKQSAQESTR